jgi:hypothetical protein
MKLLWLIYIFFCIILVKLLCQVVIMNRKRRNKKKIWLVSQNKKRLKHRTKQKIKHKNRKKKMQNFSKTTNYSYYDKKNQEFKFLAPEIFSIMDNPKETIEYFNDVIKKIDEKFHHKLTINFLLQKVNKITIDAIMYMLAITKNTKKNHNTRGSYPVDNEAKALFMNSGFLKYVYSNKNIINPSPNEDIQIRMSNDSNKNAITCKEINSIIIEKYGIARRKLQFLYDILYEMMINTNEHAYSSETFLLNNWYVYVALEEQRVKFSFLDTGIGIPNTVNKNFFEKINLLGLKTDADLILSALNGKFKTSTMQEYRGKGLPKFTKYNKTKKIRNFKIVSGKGMVVFNEEKQDYLVYNLDKRLIGTVYYFEIELSSLREEN